MLHRPFPRKSVLPTAWPRDHSVQDEEFSETAEPQPCNSWVIYNSRDKYLCHGGSLSEQWQRLLCVWTVSGWIFLAEPGTATFT